MAKQYRNHNIRFNMGDELAVQAWERLHSEEVEQSFKSQNAFVVAAINDYYERHLAKKNDPYLESREKENAFADAAAGFISGGITGWRDNALSVSAG